MGLKDRGAQETRLREEITWQQIALQGKIKGTLLNTRLLARTSCQSLWQTSLFKITGEETCLSPLSKVKDKLLSRGLPHTQCSYTSAGACYFIWPLH